MSMVSVNENNDVSFVTESPNLHFFTKMVGGKSLGPRGTQSFLLDDVNALLTKMWEESPELTIKNIFYKGDCRGGAKEKRVFMEGVKWLALNHPQWVNLKHIPEYRYWKDVVTLVSFVSHMETLFEEGVHLVAQQLISDRTALTKMKGEVSLCAKWVPSENKTKKSPVLAKFTKTLLKLLNTNMEGYRKTFLTPLRTVLQVVESLICSNQWDKINYSHVPSIALQRYRELFKKHDGERFKNWIDSLSKGENKVNTSQLFPHTIAKPYFNNDPFDSLIEAQFKQMVRDTRKLGVFTDAMVIVDTSGSMHGTPYEVATTLGIIIARCMGEPFTNFIMNFDQTPRFFKLQGDSLYEDLKTMKKLPWGGNTNLDKVFKLILDNAKKYKLKRLPSRLYILTDMQFDSCVGGSSSALERGKILLNRHGYEMPEIICWNLRGNTSTFAMTDNSKGMCMISGFTTAILTSIMKGKITSPLEIMKETLQSERYSRLEFPC